jgi:hypothetical protein
LLREAEKRAAKGPGVYGKRVAFVRAGLDFVRLMVETIPVMTRVRESGGTDVAAVREALANWESIEKIDEATGGYALDHVTLRARMRYRAFYRGGVEDYFGPPSKDFQRAAGLLPDTADGKPKAAAPSKPAPTAVAARAAKGGWLLAFSDDFGRDRLGDDWRVLDGTWSVTNGQLTGHGTLMLDKAFPGFQRLEFEAATDAGTVTFAGKEKPADVSDLSVILQARPGEEATASGYLLQFGGMRNTLHRLRRAGKTLRLDENPSVRIKPNQRHRIMAENDAGRVRLTVDGRVLLEGREKASFVGPGQDRAGLYLYTPARVFSVKLYVKPLADDTI